MVSLVSARAGTEATRVSASAKSRIDVDICFLEHVLVEGRKALLF
jgi:hypothetical protein